jgi:BNR/Asp-box repeat.
VALDVTSGDVLSSVFVLDASHAWTARPGDWGGTQPVLTFPDRQHGFLLLSGLRGGPGSTVFATADGGVTWRHVGGADRLGSVFGASDATTVWAGNEGDAGPVERPILDVSRDGGGTWTDARLPGLVGDVKVNDTLVGPPIFTDKHGVVAVIASSTEDVRFYRTTDGGRTWAFASRAPLGQGCSACVAVIDPTHFVVIDPTAGLLEATGDGGATWQQSPSTGLGAAARIRFWSPLEGAAIVQLTNGPAPAAGLFRTTDGGQTWTPVSSTGSK